MIRAVLIWLGASALGVALIAVLPEDWLGGEILFRLSDRHGPTAADAVGLALVGAGWGMALGLASLTAQLSLASLAHRARQ